MHSSSPTHLWQRCTSSVAVQHFSLPRSVAAFSSLGSHSELSAAITAAPSQLALQALAAAVASSPQQAQLAQEVEAQLLSSLEEQEPAALIKALLFFCQLGPGHEQLFQQAVPVLYNRLAGLSLPQLLGLLGAYSAAAAHSPRVYSQELFAAVTEFLWEGLGQLDAPGLAQVAACYAAVGHFHDDEDFFGGLAAAATDKLETFCPEDLSRLVAALGQLRFSAADLGAAALQQLCQQLDAWPLSAISRLLAGLAAVQHPAEPCLLDRVGGHVAVVLRNLRTSTDGQRVLSGLGARTAAAGGDGGLPHAAASLRADGSGLAGLGPGKQSRGAPTWQGFGMTRNSSSSSNSSSNSGGGAAEVWAAAAASSGLYEYQEEADNPLGPEFLTVTTFGPDGSSSTTYIKRDATSTALGSSSIGETPQPPPTSTPSSSSSSSPGGGRPGSPSSNGNGAFSAAGSSSSRGVWRSRVLQSYEECLSDWQVAGLHSDCRPVYDDAAALQDALVGLVWSFAMLGHSHASLAKECFKALALVPPEAFSDKQLSMLWAAQMRYQQLGHVMLDPNPLLAESYTVFVKELSRAAPRTISLPSHLQALAAAEYLLDGIAASPEYEQQQEQQQQQQEQQEQFKQEQQFSSWKFRDPTLLTQRGLEASVRQALLALGLPVGEPCVTLDGLERVGLPLKHQGVHIAWQVLPPGMCCRNPPYRPAVQAAMQRWALAYRGYTVLQVPFHEWAGVLESGDLMIQAGYLQRMLDGLSVRIPRMGSANL